MFWPYLCRFLQAFTSILRQMYRCIIRSLAELLRPFRVMYSAVISCNLHFQVPGPGTSSSSSSSHQTKRKRVGHAAEKSNLPALQVFKKGSEYAA